MGKTLKKILCSLLVVVMCLISAPLDGFIGIEWPDINIGEWFTGKARADFGIDYKHFGGYIFSFNKDNETLTIHAYTGTSTEMNVPSYIGTNKVIGINTDDYYLGDAISKTVKKIVLPSTIEFVNLSAPNIEEIVLSDGIKYLNVRASNVEKLVLPATIEEVNRIATKATEITIPYGATKIGECAFSDCVNLKKISLPNSIVEIGKLAFYGCTNLKTVNIPNKLQNIPEGMLYNCSKLEKINISKSVKEIGQSAFYGCRSLKNIDIFSEKLQICDAAFSFCDNLSEVILHGSIKSIGMGAFGGCYRLRKFDFGESIENIGISAFVACISLSSVSLPKTIKNIDALAFEQCFSLKNIDIYSKNATINKEAFPKYSYNIDIEAYLKINKECETLELELNNKLNSWIVSKNGNYTFEEYESQYKKIFKEIGLDDLYKKLNASVKKDKESNLLIRCYKGSTAEKYAKENGIKYKYFSNTPDEVTGFKASTITGSAITLTWDKDSDATGYIVYKYDSSSKKYVKLSSTKKNTYKVSDLKKGTTYKFKVKAYKKVNDKTYYSDTVALTTATKPGTPTLKTTAGTKSAKLTWNKQTGATGYMIYMATSKDGKYSKIATVKGNSNVSYTKKSLTTGKTYYFKIRAYKTVESTNIYGSYSSIKSVKAK